MLYQASCGLVRERRRSTDLNCAMQAPEILDEEEDKEGSMQPSGSRRSGRRPISLDLVTHEVIMNPVVSSLCCPDCHDPLDLHQPDQYDLAKLLGICGSCGNWYYVVETDAEWNRAILVELPSTGMIHAMLGKKLASA